MTVLILTLGILAITGGAIYSIVVAYQNEENDRGWSYKNAKLLLALGSLLVIFSQCFAIIPTGYSGVRTTFGQVDEVSVQNGFNLKAPFIQSIQQVNNKQQDLMIATGETTIDAAAKGKIPITIGEVKVTYQINPTKAAFIYSTVNDPDDLINFGIVSSAIKDSTITFEMDEVTVRSVVEGKTKEILQAYANDKYGDDTITIIQVILGSINFEAQYNDAVNNKNMATQQYEQAQIENKRAVEKAQADADSLKIAAQGKADAAKIEADGIAEANKKISASLNEQIIANNWIIKWDGKMPIVTDSSGNIIDISSMVGGQ